MSEQLIQKRRRTRTRIVLGLFLVFIFGAVTGIFIFQNMLRPGQQQRVINMLPFMEIFLLRPPINSTLPTALPATNGISPEDLLKITFGAPTDEPEVTESSKSYTTKRNGPRSGYPKSH